MNTPPKLSFLFTCIVSVSTAYSIIPDAEAGLVGNILQTTGLVEPINTATGLDLGQLVSPIDEVLTALGGDGDLSNLEGASFLSLEAPRSNNGNDKPVGRPGKKPHHKKSIIEPLSVPLGRGLAPLLDALDSNLDPLTDPIDETLLQPLLGLLGTTTGPLLETLEPVTSVIEGVVNDVTGGSLEDALTNSDRNTEDGNGVVNDLLGSDTNPDSGTEAGEASILPGLTAPLGESLAPLIDTLDSTLAAVTDPLDQRLLEPVLDALAPVLTPVLDTLEPVTDPVDGIVADLTGGSLEDALTNDDDNTADGNGLVNDLIGGSKYPASGTEEGEASLLPAVTEPLGEMLSGILDRVDTVLNPLTDPVDDELLEPVLDALEPVLTPLLDTLAPVTDAVDGTLADLTGGSLEDALTNDDDNTADGNGVVNDLIGGRAEQADSGDGEEKSLLGPITAPLGKSLAPLFNSLATTLSPLTDVLDDEVLEMVLDGASPLTEPLLTAIEPVTDVVDGVVADVTGGSLEDALTNNDDNTADGNGVVNDLLPGEVGPENGLEADEASLLPLLTEPLGETLKPLVDAVDRGLDPLTDVVDDQLLEPVLDGIAPVTEPLLATVEPLTDPIDGTLADLTGGSLEDALTNNDDNTADGNGVVNDLLGGEFENTASGSEVGEQSLLGPITEPLGVSLAPLLDALDIALDPVTDALDDQILELVVGGASPLTEPLLTALQPVTDVVDGIVADVTGGSVEDALTNNDDNAADGNGVVNDLLGGPSHANSGSEAGEASLLPMVTEPLGEALAELVTSIDTGLDPLTDVVDDQLIEPILDAVAPGLDPLLEALEPVTDPVDGTLADLTGGSLEDALTNNDDNTVDGNGLVNDLLGGEAENMASGSEAGEQSILGPITQPLGESLAPLVDAVNTALDPLTDMVDDELLEQVLDGANPLTEPLLEAAEPVTDVVDGIVADVTGGSVEDALTNNDDNTADGNGAVNDILGDSSNANSGSEASLLPAVTGPLGSVIDSLISSVDEGLDPVTDIVDKEIVAPILDTLSPTSEPLLTAAAAVTDPVDGTVADLTGGSVEDALTNNDDNTADGNGLVNDLLGGGKSGLGVLNIQDALPAQLALADSKALTAGSCKDSDRDGICDLDDNCSKTAAGAAVLSNGCVLDGFEAMRLEGVNFENDSHILTSDSEEILQQAANYILRSPGKRFEVSGHTDDVADESYNRRLSQARADAVMAYLVDQGIDVSQLQAVGYGESQPVSDNDSETGRAENRRVELKLLKNP
ncbi:MAG: OmpA family protein [Spongiibacteraceae bacterium]